MAPIINTSELKTNRTRLQDPVEETHRENGNDSSIFTLSKDSKLPDIINSNSIWVNNMNKSYPLLFPEYNGKGQKPHTLFIGCSDSRYNESILGVLPGEVFTWRSIANLCLPDCNIFKSTLEYALLCLKVNKIIICGHTDCGGIMTCLRNERDSLLKQGCSTLYDYLEDVENMYNDHLEQVKIIKGGEYEKGKYLSTINLVKQFDRIVSYDIVQNGIKNNQLEVYGLIYNVHSGLVDVVETKTLKNI
ncbi:carbonate dehydratase NCE103 NDAI_0G00570 [Naumovozyma dairenensis CBS 421]|uniref:Carbonic anhydrase n=1 Tax=Naumovozyma dairenensis (strain ATCC 10597 / BCRC 20456 / CBS 421 / NBRC 0211 / NRRL Y-12639) TaxID=1071378 RepID=G0WDH2_NAUDC|nr:hypothetical protein NDAI_0G00570 [Naumovozyma dairenensis CBS 421]CCD25833.2 hypothetical protein NDAI_0G00570 [Naumovozyma dairenensis CBS 421]